jgi:hypothetical protein
MQSACPSVSTRARRALMTCALAGSIAVGLSACGSSGSSAAASSSSSSSSSSGSSARVKYAECLRSHGVNVPDPTAGGGAPGGGGGAPGGGGTSTTGGGPGGFRQLLSTPTGQAAEKACASLRSKSFGGPGGNPADSAKFAADAVKFAECMRAHNIAIPDPSSSSGGAFGIFKDLRGSSETNSPAFKTAMTACASNLPNGGHFGRGGAGGTTTGSVGGPGA